MNPATKPLITSLFSGRDKNDQPIPDPRGGRRVDRKALGAIRYPSRTTNLYAMNLFNDGARNGRGTSIWDSPETQVPFLVGDE